jgi:carbon-monoxide dehydrogenase small subunit
MHFTVNGQQVEASDPEQNLLEFLREELDLIGAKDGCSIGICGTCTILIDDVAIKSCIKKVKDIDGKRVTTIEGLAGRDGGLHPLQQAFMDAGAVQCGFCIPGMILTSHAFLLKNPRPTRDAIRKAINPNLCRCTGYHQIIDAVEMAAAHYPLPS